jgi:signal transduction histidine kinase
MENVIDGGCTNSNLILNVKKKTVRFKAGADLSSSVNKMDVDVIEELDDKFETLVVSISLGQQQCAKEI